MSIDPLVAALIALVGVLVAQGVILHQGVRAERRWRREQSLEMLRWAAELSVDADPKRAELGVAALRSLEDSPLLDDQDQLILTATFGAAVQGDDDVVVAAYAEDEPEVDDERG